jgi:hypothetical protein
MPHYLVHFLDRDGDIIATHEAEYADDLVAIEAGHRLNRLPYMSIGFDVWRGERLVRRHRNSRGPGRGSDPR